GNRLASSAWPSCPRMSHHRVARRKRGASVKAKRIPGQTEKGFMATLKQFAELHGWSWYHTRDSRRSPEGFPDVVLVRERVIYAELKTDVGKLTLAQKEWLSRLRAAGQEVYIWRPCMWPEIEATLARRD